MDAGGIHQKECIWGNLSSGNRVRGIVMTAMKVETPGEVDS